VQRSEDRCDKRFRSFNHSTCKTVLNLLEAVYLRFRKIVVERVTVVKFRVDNRGSNGTGCFRIKVRTSRDPTDFGVLLGPHSTTNH